MLTYTITATGKTSTDIEHALTEALSRIKSGNFWGADATDGGSFSFVSEGESELPDWKDDENDENDENDEDFECDLQCENCSKNELCEGCDE